MRRKLIIDGNAVYEIDDECEARCQEIHVATDPQEKEATKSQSSSVNISLRNTRNPRNNYKNIH